MSDNRSPMSAAGAPPSDIRHPISGIYYRSAPWKTWQRLTLPRQFPVQVEIDGRKTVVIDLHGELAGILSLASNAEKPLDKSGSSVESIKMVAGVGFEPTTFRL